MNDQPSKSGIGNLKKRFLPLVILLVAVVAAKRFGIEIPGLTGSKTAKPTEASREEAPPRTKDPVENRTPENRTGSATRERPRPSPVDDRTGRSTNSKPSMERGTKASSDDGGAARVASLRRAEQSGVDVTVRGVVTSLLPPDNDGKPHQRFILKLSDGTTLLVAHNLSLAEKVPLERFDDVEIKGQFEANERGGVLHWTHHDPAKRHAEGWIKHKGRVYQ